MSFDRQRQGIGERRIVGKLDRERLLQARALVRNRRNPRAAALLGREIALRRLLRHRGDDRLVERLGLGREILVPAHQLGEPVAAGGKPHRELVHGGGGGGLRAALDRGERLVQRLVAGQQILLARGEQDRQHDAQLRAIGRKRLFRERQRVRGAPGDVEEISEIAGRGHDVRMIGPERTFADRQRTAIERLRIGIALLVLVETGEIVEGARDVGMVRSQHFFRGSRASA